MATLMDLSPDEFKNLMRDALGGAHLGGQSSRVGTSNVFGDARDEAARKKMIEDFKKMHTGADKIVNMLRKQHATYVDISDQLKKFDEEIENAANETEREVKREEKASLQRAAAEANTRAAIANTGVLAIKAGEGLTNLAKSSMASAGNLTKSFLNGSSGVGIATEMVSTSLDLAGNAGKAMGSGMQEVGGALMQTKGKLRGFGAALEIAGAATSFAADSVSKLLKFGTEILGKEIEKTVKAFNTVTSSGAMFGRGMDDIIMYSGRAGLTLDQFSNVIKNNAGVLAESGYTVTDAAKIVSNVTSQFPKMMGKSGLTLQREMLNLGYSFEEQANMVAQVTGDLRKSGGQATNGAVAQATLEMGRNMRVVADIMGQDAKAKMDEAKKQSEQYAFNAKLREIAKQNNDPGLIKRVQAGLSLMDETQRRAVIQATVLGGAVTDVAANVYGYADAARESSRSILSGAKDIADIASPMAKVNDQLSQGTDSTMQAISVANIATGSLGDLAKAADSLGQTSFQLTSENLAKAIANVNQASAYNQGMQANLMNIETQMQSSLVLIQNMLLEHSTKFTDVLDQMVSHMANIIKENLGGAPEHEEGFFSKHKKGLLMAGGVALEGIAALGTIGTLGLAAPVTAAIGLAGTSMMGVAAGMEGGYAGGGIATGDKDGHQELLHGTELVVPLTSDGSEIVPNTEGQKQLSALLGNAAKRKDTVAMNATDFASPTPKVSTEALNTSIDRLADIKPAEPAQLSWPKEFTTSFASIETALSSIKMPEISASGITDSIESLGETLSKTAISPLRDAVDSLTDMLIKNKNDNNQTAASAQMNEDMIAALSGLINTAKDQLQKQDEMLRAMQDTRDATERLYHVMS